MNETPKELTESGTSRTPFSVIRKGAWAGGMEGLFTSAAHRPN